MRRIIMVAAVSVLLGIAVPAVDAVGVPYREPATTSSAASADALILEAEKALEEALAADTLATTDASAAARIRDLNQSILLSRVAIADAERAIEALRSGGSTSSGSREGLQHHSPDNPYDDRDLTCPDGWFWSYLNNQCLPKTWEEWEKHVRPKR